MKRKQILAIITCLLLLAVVVAAGVHILHKKAFADTIVFRCYIHDGLTELTDDDVELEYHIYDSNGVIDAGNMDYSQTANFYHNFNTELGEWTHWDVFIVGNEVQPEDPDENPTDLPCPVTYLDWEVLNP